MNSTQENVSELMAGLSFLNSETIEIKANTSGKKKLTKERQTVKDLLEAISRSDSITVERLAPQCTKINSRILKGRIARALVANGFDHASATALWQSDLLDAQVVFSTMKTSNSWAGMGWIGSNQELIKRFEHLVGRATQDAHNQIPGARNHLCDLLGRALGDPSGQAAIKFMDLPFMFRGIGSTRTHYIQGYGFCISSLLNENPTGDNYKALDRFFEERLVESAYCNESQLQLRWRRAALTNNIIQWVLYESSGKKMAATENYLRHCPNLRGAWKDYWSIPKNQDSLKNTGLILFSSTDRKNLEKQTGLKFGRHQDLIDTLLARPNQWLHEVLTSKNKVADKFYERLMEGGTQLNQLVANLEYKTLSILLPHLISRLGVNWENSEGQNLGQAILLSCKKPSRSIIQRIMREPHGREIILSKNRQGTITLDMIFANENWHASKGYLLQLKRRLLIETSKIAQAERPQTAKSRDTQRSM